MQAGSAPQDAKDNKLLEHDVEHYQAKLKTRKEVRRRKQEVHEKRVKRRDTYRTDVDERREKRDNIVYYDGMNYTIRWSCMPRSEFFPHFGQIFLNYYH